MGSTLVTPELRRRFWAKVDKSPGHGPWGNCHVWTGAGIKRKFGYGGFILAGVNVRATKVAWFFKYKVWPKKHVLHRCDYPSCVRWSHLFEGSNRDNVNDMVAKGRQRGAPGEQNANCKLSDKQVQYVRKCCRQYTRGLYSRLGRKLGVSGELIGKIARNKIRKVI